MADKEKKVAKNSEVEKATTEESKAAAKVAKAAKGSKSDKPGFFARASKGTKRFFKDFKGECKKIVWPDAKTVLKSTGVVLLVVAIVTAIIFVIDFGLEQGMTGLKNLARGDETTVSSTVDEHEGHDHGDEGEETDGDTTTEAKEADGEESTTASEEETTEATEK